MEVAMRKLKIGAIVVCAITALAGIAWLINYMFFDEYDPCCPCKDDDEDCHCSR